MKKFTIILLILMLSVIIIVVNCSKKIYDHCNPLDPDYEGLLNGDDDGDGDEGSAGLIMFDENEYYLTNQKPKVTVLDDDLSGPNLTVKVKSTSDPTGIDLVLTNVNGNYTSTFNFSEYSSSGVDKRLLVANGDSVTATYQDQDPKATKVNTVKWYSILWIADGDKLNSTIKGVINGQGLDYMYNTANGVGFASLTPYSDYMEFTTSAGHGGWAFVAIYVKPAALPIGSRDYIDLSSYTKIAYRMRASTDLANGVVQMSLKDRSDGDGAEQKINLDLDTTWISFTNNLSDIGTLNKAYTYFVFELVFGTANVTVYFDDVKFIK